ncbi:MAG: cation transporter [Coriobacteriales bacterium]
MKRSLKLEGLCCANCAAKIEDGINALPQVESAKVAFMTEKLILQAPDEAWENVLEQAQQVVCKYEPDCRIVR